MYKFKVKVFLLSVVFILLSIEKSVPCSMYKVTVGGKTMVGNNEDSWRLTSQIWFEQGTKDKYGVAYVGYSDKTFGDGAVNEYGLAFDAFTMPHKSNLKIDRNKKDGLSYQVLKTVMQQCKTIDNVYDYLNKYNLDFLNGSPLFNGGMLLFIDKSGKYMSVEADTMIIGNDNKYVLANFSVGGTKDLSTIKIERYCKGVDFLKNKIDTSLVFCSALSDTMHVCRKKVGDGTLYTSIYDLTNGMIYLYFYHDYKNLVTFNLKNELAKGDHAYSIPTLFPKNKEYEKFSSFKTPQNNKAMFWFLVSTGILLILSSLYFLISFFKTNKNNSGNIIRFSYLKLILFLICPMFSFYSFVLLWNQSIFYFPSPYYDSRFSILNIAAYIPFLLLILIIPLIIANLKIYRKNVWTNFSKGLFTLNNLVFAVLLIMFFYWGLFDVFN